VDSFLLRDNDELAETISKPQEDARLQIPREFLLGTINEIEEVMQSCVCELVFNLNEVGIGVSEWEDRKSKKVVVPTAMGSKFSSLYFLDHIIPDLKEANMIFACQESWVTF
jgi:hypothetical protein